jgi:hypothetical protein
MTVKTYFETMQETWNEIALAEVLMRLNDAQRLFARRTKCLLTEVALDELDFTNGRSILSVDIESIRSSGFVDISGKYIEPNLWTFEIRNRYVYLYYANEPTGDFPTNADTLRLRGTKLPATLSLLTDEPEIPEEFHDALLWKAISDKAILTNKADLAKMAQSKWAEQVVYGIRYANKRADDRVILWRSTKSSTLRGNPLDKDVAFEPQTFEVPALRRVGLSLSSGTPTTNTIPLSWTGSNETGAGFDLVAYDVYYGVGNGLAEDQLTLLATTTNHSYTANGLTTNQSYTFMVKGRYTPDALVRSNIVSATTSGIPYIYIFGNIGANLGCRVVDISNPASPSVVSNVTFGSIAINLIDGYQMSMDDRYIYGNFWMAGSKNYRFVFSIADPTNPTLIYREDPSGPNLVHLGMIVRTGKTYANNIMYLNSFAAANKTIRVMDVSNMASPSLLQEVTIPSGAYNDGTMVYDATRNRVYFTSTNSAINGSGLAYYDVASDGRLTFGLSTSLFAGSIAYSSWGLAGQDKYWLATMRANRMNAYGLDMPPITTPTYFPAWVDNSFHSMNIQVQHLWKNTFFFALAKYVNASAYPVEIVDITESANPITNKRHIGSLGETAIHQAIVGNYLYWLRGSDAALMVTNLSNMDSLSASAAFSPSGVSHLAIVGYDPLQWSGNNGQCYS